MLQVALAPQVAVVYVAGIANIVKASGVSTVGLELCIYAARALTNIFSRC